MPVVPITHLQFQDKKVLVRCDFNVPLAEGKIQDPARIDASLDTIRYILEHGGSAVLCSHLGRPKERSAELSLKPVAEYLTKVLGQKIKIAPDCVGDHTGKMIEALKPGEALLLENLRFHREEEANDRDFSHELARHKQVYVNDGFGTAHRAHASTVGVTRFLAERAAGFLMMRELDALRAVTENPAHPSVAILGGAKVSDKIGVIRNLLGKVDIILIGGAMAYTFLKAAGLPIGNSRVEEDKLDLARQILQEAKSHKLKFLLPVDHIVADRIDVNAVVHVVNSGQPIPPNMMGLDIGPQTVELFSEEISRARTIVWNGPMGVFEVSPFSRGTSKIAHAIAENVGAISIVGGGDSVSAVHAAGVADKMTHISTGGGASLEFLEGKKLPGVEALTDKR